MGPRPLGGAANSRLLFAAPWGPDWDVGTARALCACALSPRSAKDGARGARCGWCRGFPAGRGSAGTGSCGGEERLWAGGPWRRAGNRAARCLVWMRVSWADLPAGHREEHLHHPGCGPRDSGQGHAQAARRPALRAAFQGALPGVCAAGWVSQPGVDGEDRRECELASGYFISSWFRNCTF